MSASVKSKLCLPDLSLRRKEICIIWILFSGNFLALKVKLHDLRNNLDITRIPDPTEKDYARLERYKQEYKTLIQALDNIANDH